MREQVFIKRVLIIGAGIAGIQAALDTANAGYEVLLVERRPFIGGRMAQLSETYPTLDCSQCILAPRIVEVAHHQGIRLLTYSEVESARGRIGDFQVAVRHHPRYVIPDRCNGCGDCAQVCPIEVPNEFERGTGPRRAIYVAHAQAVPPVYTIDTGSCIRCYKCVDACGKLDAIDFSQQPQETDENVGAIIVATGYDLYPKGQLGEYGYGKYPDVIDGLQYERLISASGPTDGALRRPSDGRVPKEVVFVQCAGSRDPENALSYCSKICCMYTAKHALLYAHRVPDGQAYVFYIDIRATGKGYEEFVQRATEEGVLYLRGKVSRVFQENGKVIVWGTDTLSGHNVELAADMVVLATGIVPSPGSVSLGRALGLETDSHGFFVPLDPNLRPMETRRPGIFLAGVAEGPRDIPETVAQASGAAAKVLSLFNRTGDPSS